MNLKHGSAALQEQASTALDGRPDFNPIFVKEAPSDWLTGLQSWVWLIVSSSICKWRRIKNQSSLSLSVSLSHTHTHAIWLTSFLHPSLLPALWRPTTNATILKKNNLSFWSEHTHTRVRAHTCWMVKARETIKLNGCNLQPRSACVEVVG